MPFVIVFTSVSPFFRSFAFPRLLSSKSNKWVSKFVHTHTRATLEDDESGSALAAINLTDCQIVGFYVYAVVSTVGVAPGPHALSFHWLFLLLGKDT